MSKPGWWSSAEPDVDSAVALFAEKIQAKITAQNPAKLIAGKNPFLFRARVSKDANLYARMVVDAFLSSSEETMFGNVLEEIAIAVCNRAKGGWKSGTSGIDLEYDEEEWRIIVQVKSGKNWGNSSQRKKLLQDFNTATRILRQGANINVRCVEGVCYGQSLTKDFGTHWQLVGNDFWYAISGWQGTAQAVLQVIGQHAGNGLREVRKDAVDGIVAYLMSNDAVTPTGRVRWKKVLDLVM